MSDDAERPDSSAPSGSPAVSAEYSAHAPGPAAAPDPDAWATACEEDLAAEKARRRAEYGPPPTSAAEELRRLADAVTDKVTELGKPLFGAVGTAAAQGVAQQLFAQAKATIEPVVERNPQLFDHLAAAGGELLAAYRSVVQESERRWSEPKDANAAPPAAGTERIDLDDRTGADEQGGQAGPDERVVLDAQDEPTDDARSGEENRGDESPGGGSEGPRTGA
ncbi:MULTISPECIES: DUF5304 family protein [unclassified Streptomyces]|uniref:DUF5304 family protein n=1 Tax=unclassified Streptomyces TaxID=2593676 RepID=UPI002DDB6B96|nr:MULTISPECIES: DUF5304 family protein [unclassified Streptomyces]WSA95288.1 DUF5304 domain-containing protein [Streptomyces sp. NBC_01795]WSB79706.1 DUF5304 domain-containing protein [Streptomyces sp. NBC_01775]WSS12088.1 DUF5304 domain-containing protein [Streptomyces sp. NBC_01186]WSS40801.1 DUF5304 domain-containing protein [Streptomyces sp. NBC_01187]